MSGSKLIINNQVMMSGAKSHVAIGKSRLLYIANRQGAVTLRTEDDLRIEAENERMAKLGYIAYRPGSVPEPNKGHALFDAHGIPQRAVLQHELVSTQSAIMTTVVSVRREDAETMRLETKQDWERLLRSQWPQYVESLGVMEPQNIRWVAAYHVNQQNNLHCHVFTWDASGQFNDLVPRAKMTQANGTLQAFVLKPQQESLNLARTQARDELVARMHSIALDSELAQSVKAALPETGSLKYASLERRQPVAAAKISSITDTQIESTQELSKLREDYCRAVRANAELKCLTGQQFEAYVDAAMSDLQTRANNALIANVRGVDSPTIKPVPALNKEQLLLPKDRRQVQMFTEEISSCLKPNEQAQLRHSLESAFEEQEDSQTKQLFNKIPALQCHFEAIISGLAANASKLTKLFSMATSANKGDTGDDVGQRAIRIGSRVLAAAMNFALRHSPPQRKSAPTVALKNPHIQKLS